MRTAHRTRRLTHRGKVNANQIKERKMAHEDYRLGITNLAYDEAAGEDISEGVSRLAGVAGLDPSSVRQDVTEAAEMVE